MIRYQKMIYRADLRANPDTLYVFGDNEQRVGNGGQAGEMRGEPNAIGVATLSFEHPWGDHDFLHQAAVIDADLAPVVAALLLGQEVVLPLDGIGTGIAQLRERSPGTFEHLQIRWRQLALVRRSLTKLALTPRRDPAAFTRRVLG